MFWISLNISDGSHPFKSSLKYGSDESHPFKSSLKYGSDGSHHFKSSLKYGSDGSNHFKSSLEYGSAGSHDRDRDTSHEMGKMMIITLILKIMIRSLKKGIFNMKPISRSHS